MLLSDLRQACRTLTRAPVLAAVVIVSLGIGIVGNPVVSSWSQAVVWQPMPAVAGSGSFYWVEPRTDSGGYPGASWLEYGELRQRLRTFRDPLAFRMAPLYVGQPGRVDRAYGLLVSGNYFSALGLAPAAGRLLRADDVSRPGGEMVAVISYDYWQNQFGGARSVPGRTLRVNGYELTIVGVAPRGFQGTHLALSFDLYLPAT